MSESAGERGLVCFSHGKESGPWGLKITELADVAWEQGWDVESIDYRGLDDPMARVEKLVEYCRTVKGPLVLAGSSMGGAVTAHAATMVPTLGVYLMATAVYVPGYEDLNPAPLTVPAEFVHGWRDSVIPFQNALRFALECKAGYSLLDDEHGLAGSIPQLKHSFGNFLQARSSAIKI